MKIGDVLKRKGSGVVTIRSDSTIDTVVRRMRLERIGAVIMSPDGKSVVGILSERDILHALAEHGTALLRHLRRCRGSGRHCWAISQGPCSNSRPPSGQLWVRSPTQRHSSGNGSARRRPNRPSCLRFLHARQRQPPRLDRRCEPST